VPKKKQKTLLPGIVEVTYTADGRHWRLRGPAAKDTPDEVYDRIPGAGKWYPQHGIIGYPSNISPRDWRRLCREWDKARYTNAP
jgi:hypothetical protein